jgi:hypothetical protein
MYSIWFGRATRERTTRGGPDRSSTSGPVVEVRVRLRDVALPPRRKQARLTDLVRDAAGGIGNAVRLLLLQLGDRRLREPLASLEDHRAVLERQVGAGLVAHEVGVVPRDGALHLRYGVSMKP